MPAPAVATRSGGKADHDARQSRPIAMRGLPDALTCTDGSPVRNRDDWYGRRVGELHSLFDSHVPTGRHGPAPCFVGFSFGGNDEVLAGARLPGVPPTVVAPRCRPSSGGDAQGYHACAGWRGGTGWRAARLVREARWALHHRLRLARLARLRRPMALTARESQENDHVLLDGGGYLMLPAVRPLTRWRSMAANRMTTGTMPMREATKR